MADNIEDIGIDFDQLESEHSRMLEQVKLDKALSKKDDDPAEKVEEDIIKLKTHTSTSKNTDIEIVESFDKTMDEFDCATYDPYDVGSGNSRFHLGDTDNIWHAHAWPDDVSSEEQQEDIDDFFANQNVQSKMWNTSDRKWSENRPLSKYSKSQAKQWQEQEEEDMISVVNQTADDIKYGVDHMTNTMESLESDIQEINTTTTFTSNTVSGLEGRVKNMEKNMSEMRKEVKTIRDYLEIIIQYYAESSDAE